MNAWLKPTKIEWQSFFILMPLLTVLLNHMLYGNRIWTDRDVWLYSFTLVYVQGFISWYAHLVVMHWLRRRFPHISQTTLRLSLLALAHLGLTYGTFAMIFYGYDAVHYLGYTLNPTKFKFMLLLAIGLTMVATTRWEADYTFKQWKESLAENEKLQQLTLQHEFETLKSQVNPHFLFNCFNTLSSLITEDHKQAEAFLNELSKVYRYLLRNNEDGLSTLENELRFIHSYFQLLMTRYGDALQVNIEVDKRYEQYLLPSLSLQLLVENAVKHNVVARKTPLVIDIFTAAGNILVVNNNLQLKQAKPSSNRIGLENIRSKYELIRQPGFQVLQDTRNFSVVLPLVWSPVLEGEGVHDRERNRFKSIV